MNEEEYRAWHREKADEMKEERRKEAARKSLAEKHFKRKLLVLRWGFWRKRWWVPSIHRGRSNPWSFKGWRLGWGPIQVWDITPLNNGTPGTRAFGIRWR